MEKRHEVEGATSGKQPTRVRVSCLVTSTRPQCTPVMFEDDCGYFEDAMFAGRCSGTRGRARLCEPWGPPWGNYVPLDRRHDEKTYLGGIAADRETLVSLEQS